MDKTSLSNSFTYHAPKPEQIPKYENFRKLGHELALAIYESQPPSAESTLAIRAVENAIMWANKGIACNT